MRNVLLEVVESPVQILQEAKPENGHRMHVKAKLMQADVVNENKRVYRKAIVKREVDRLQERVQNGTAFASGDHPADGRTNFDNVAALWKKVWLDGSEVFGEAVILNTARGRNLQEVLRVSKAMPVSARGMGDLRAGQWQGQPAEIVEDNYELVTFDFVLNNPGFEDAKVTSVSEEQTTREQTSAFVRHQQDLAGLVPDTPQDRPTLSVTQRREQRLSGVGDDGDAQHEHILQEGRRKLSLVDELRQPFWQQHLAGLRSTDGLNVSSLAEQQLDLHAGDEPIWSVLEREGMLLEQTPALPRDLLGLSVYAALRQKFPLARPLELFSDCAIVSEGGALVKIPFQLDDKMEVTLGRGEKVAIEYVPAVAWA